MYPNPLDVIAHSATPPRGKALTVVHLDLPQHLLHRGAELILVGIRTHALNAEHDDVRMCCR